MAPLSYLADWMGATVKQDAAHHATFTLAPHTFVVKAGEAEALADGKTLKLPATAEELDGALYVPAASLLRALDGKVDYNPKTNELTLSLPKGAEPLTVPLNPKKYHSAALHLDAYAGLAKLARLHVARKDDVNAPESQLQMTPLHFAAFRGNTAVVEVLLEHHARVNAQSTQGVSPLMLAAMAGRTAVAQKLLTAGANIELRDIGNATPLLGAAKAGQYETFDFLRRHGADLRARNNGGQSVMHMATFANSIPIASYSLAEGLYVNDHDNQRMEPLHLAIALNHQEFVSFLLGRGADVNAKMPNGYTPLKLAKKLKLVKIEKLLRDRAARE